MGESKHGQDTMTSRERVLTAINHQEPDRVPIDLGTTDTFMAAEVVLGLAQLLGMDSPIAQAAPHPGAYITPDESILEALGADVRLVGVPQKPQPSSIGGNTDVKMETLSDGTMQWTYPDGRVLQRPVGTWDTQLFRPAIIGDLTDSEINRVLPPGATSWDWADRNTAKANIQQWHEKGKCVQCNHIIMPVTGTNGGILDFTRWCMELATQPDLLCKLMDRALEHSFAHAESFYAAVGDNMDLVYGLGDDVASHTALWMSPTDYRRYIKPRHAEIISFIKKRTKAKIIHHCCGACYNIIPDLIEIGVDILNPTQTSATGMDPFQLKRDFGRDIAFWGGIDVIHLLPFGTQDEVKSEVKRHIDALAPEGGYIFAPSHMILRGTPPENVLTMYMTALEYG